MNQPLKDGALASKVALITPVRAAASDANSGNLFRGRRASYPLLTHTFSIERRAQHDRLEPRGRDSARGRYRNRKGSGRMVHLAITQYGRLDIVINNAGILGPRVPIAEYPHREWAQVLRINLNGTFLSHRPRRTSWHDKVMAASSRYHLRSDWPGGLDGRLCGLQIRSGRPESSLSG